MQSSDRGAPDEPLDGLEDQDGWARIRTAYDYRGLDQGRTRLAEGEGSARIRFRPA